MFPTVVATGVRDAYQLLHGIATRAGDPSPAWSGVADDVLDFQRRWWLTGGGGTWDDPSPATIARDRRDGRDPRMMIDTGGLMAAATVRGAPRQVIDIGRSYLFVGLNHGLGVIHEKRGRDVIGVPPRREALGYARDVLGYILTGRT